MRGIQRLDMRKLARKEGIVRVQEQQDIAPGRGKPSVEAGGLTAIFLQHRDDTVAIAFDDGAGIVGGTVIDHDHFEIGVVL